MHYPEFDALCHEVAGKLSELRRLTMETVILTDDQEALLAELTRLLRLTDATSSQQIHSLLGDTTTPDSVFLAELRDELPLLTSPAERMALSPEGHPKASLPHEGRVIKGREVAEPCEGGEMAFPLRVPLTGHDPAVRFAHCDINGVWWAVAMDSNTALRFDSRADLDAYLAAQWQTERENRILRWPPEDAPARPPEVMIPEGMLELTYWDIRPTYPDDFRLLFARDTENKYCLIVTDNQGQTALLFDTEEDRSAYLAILEESEG